MKMDRAFNNILNECLERLLQGENVEQCLQRYPEQASRLKPLLETIQMAEALSRLQPRPEFKARAGYEFRRALREAKSKRSYSFFGWVRQPQWATVMASVLVFLLASGGTVAAASGSMPDGRLYPVKLATERVQLVLTPSPVDKAELYAKLADKRVAEINYLVNENKPEKIESTVQRLDNDLSRMASLPLAREKSGEVATSQLAPTPEALLAPAPAIAPVPTPAPTRVPAPAPVTTPTPTDDGGQPVPPPAVSFGEFEGKTTIKTDSEKSEKDVKRGAKPTADAEEKLKERLEHYAAEHESKLREALEKAPESAKPALRRAIEVSEDHYKKTISALDDRD